MLTCPSSHFVKQLRMDAYPTKRNARKAPVFDHALEVGDDSHARSFEDAIGGLRYVQLAEYETVSWRRQDKVAGGKHKDESKLERCCIRARVGGTSHYDKARELRLSRDAAVHSTPTIATSAAPLVRPRGGLGAGQEKSQIAYMRAERAKRPSNHDIPGQR